MHSPLEISVKSLICLSSSLNLLKIKLQTQSFCSRQQLKKAIQTFNLLDFVFYQILGIILHAQFRVYAKIIGGGECEFYTGKGISLSCDPLFHMVPSLIFSHSDNSEPYPLTYHIDKIEVFSLDSSCLPLHGLKSLREKKSLTWQSSPIVFFFQEAKSLVLPTLFVCQCL